jgi:glycosyltransferase involved in cell wall biosynthesis
MSAKRALVCAPLVPEFDRESGSKRIYDTIEGLREADWEVSFAAENASGGERYMRMLQQRGVATYAGFNPLTEKVIAASAFDLAIFAFWYIGEMLTPTMRKVSPATRIVVDSIDVHFLRNTRRAFRRSVEHGPTGVLGPDSASEMVREMNVYAAADTVLTVSQKEADLINDLVGDPTLAFSVPDREDTDVSTVPFSDRKGILFIGNLRHPPNVEALVYLCRDILPRLDSKVTANHPIYIVGNALTKKMYAYGSGLPNVRMVGWVPSVLPYLQRTRISVIPLLHGAGTKRKLIQALMVGTPTVSTTVGTEGLGLRDGKHVLIADDPATFAGSIVRLLKDAKLWRRLARQGRDHIMPLHGSEAVQARFMQVISTVLAKEAKLSLSTELTPELLRHYPEQQYHQLVERIREVIRTTLPLRARVIVVSKGDEALLDLGGRRGWHFPQAEGGGPERLFGEGAQGSIEVPWIETGKGYEFRLYAGTDRAKRLATVTVTPDEWDTPPANPARSPGGAFVAADPNPVLAGSGFGATTLNWSTGDGSDGQVYLSVQGEYAGHYPSGSEEAIAHLEALQASGGEFVVFPATSLWWLEHYEGFGKHLRANYRLIYDREDTCLIFSLREPAGHGREHETAAQIPHLADISGDLQERGNRHGGAATAHQRHIADV